MNPGLPSAIPRRQFLKLTAAAAAFQLLRSPSLHGAQRLPANSKVNVAGIGIGSRGGADVSEVAALGHNIVALCDVDDTYAAKEFAKHPGARRFKDYRVMFDRLGPEIDAVVIGTPDHTHAIIAMEAMRRGKHVYCEKPLAHAIDEIRALMAAAHKYKVVTQLGNQGHASPAIRQVCEWVGPAPSDASTPFTPRAVPTKMSIARFRTSEKSPRRTRSLQGSIMISGFGPVPFRPYSPLWVPWNWRGWMPFGGGVIGDWICHVVDPAYWALDLGAPSTIRAETPGYDTNQQGLTYPPAATITFEFPARKNRGPVQLVWHDGNAAIPRPAGFPADEKLPETGALLIGDKGMIVHGSHGAANCRLLPKELMEAHSGPNAPAQKIPRVQGHAWDWIEAIHTGRQAGSHFDYGGPLTELALLGLIAIRYPNQVLQWNGKSMKFAGNNAATALVHAEYRRGWKL